MSLTLEEIVNEIGLNMHVHDCTCGCWVEWDKLYDEAVERKKNAQT